MFKNYLIVSLRNMCRHKIYSCINISGLAVGITCCILALLFVQDEFSFDRFHEKADRIYRMLRGTQIIETDIRWDHRTSGPLGDALKEFPDVEQVVRLMKRAGTQIQYGEREFDQTFCLADASVFEVFDFPLRKGAPETVLGEAASVVLTQKMAEQFFGNEDPIGKVLSVSDPYFEGDFTVTGVMENLPRHSTIRFDCLASPTPRIESNKRWNQWIRSGYRYIEIYVLLREGVSASALEPELQDIIQQHMGKEIRDRDAYRLQSLVDIHLQRGDLKTVYAFGCAGAFVLLIAGINFVNLSTARSVRRAREVGVRKVVGAHQRQLIKQFLGESIFLALLSTVLALGLIELAVPYFNEFVQKPLSLWEGNTGLMILGLIGVVLIVGISAGSYPAFFLSAFHPTSVIKGLSGATSGRTRLRKGLVIFQFAISVVLIIATGVVYQQLNYLHHKNLGFERKQTLLIPIFQVATRKGHVWGKEGDIFKWRYNAVKAAYLKHPKVLAATVVNGAPGIWAGLSLFRADGQDWRMKYYPVDEDFLSFFNIEMVAGRFFTRAYMEAHTPRDSYQFILNETAVKQLGWDNPIGKTLIKGNMTGQVIGVIKDFHTGSLRNKQEATVLMKNHHNLKALMLKIRPEDLPETMDFLKATWEQFIPKGTFYYLLLDDWIDNVHYAGDRRLGKIFATLGGLAIFVACLGLFGLAMFSSEQRTKEIGIRKILGASTGNIVRLLYGELILPVVIANILAWPFAYYTMERWLQDFAYRINLNLGIFIFGGVLVFVIALTTVSYQALKAANANPIEALRYE